MSYLGAVRAGALAVVFGCVPAIAHAETLKEALASAYTNNPTIMSALLDVKSTAEGIALAKSGKLPTIGVSASSGATWTVGDGLPNAGLTSTGARSAPATTRPCSTISRPTRRSSRPVP